MSTSTKEHIELKQLITGLSGELKELKTQIQETEDKMIEHLQAFASDLSGQLKQVKGDVSQLKQDMTQVKGDVETIAKELGFERNRKGQLQKTA